MPNGGEASGGQVPQIVVLRRGPERAYPSVGERGPQKQGREIPGSPGNRGGGVRISRGGVACMGAKAPVWIGGSGLGSKPSPGGPARRLERSRAGQLVAATDEVRRLGGVARQPDGPVVCRPRLLAPAQPAQQVGAGGVE